MKTVNAMITCAPTSVKNRTSVTIAVVRLLIAPIWQVTKDYIVVKNRINAANVVVDFLEPLVWQIIIKRIHTKKTAQGHSG